MYVCLFVLQAAQLASLPALPPETAASYSMAAAELLQMAARLLSLLGPTLPTFSAPNPSAAASPSSPPATSSAAAGTSSRQGTTARAGSGSGPGAGTAAPSGGVGSAAAAAGAATAAAALGQLWPLGQRTFLMQLLDSLEPLQGKPAGGFKGGLGLLAAAGLPKGYGQLAACGLKGSWGSWELLRSRRA